MPTHRPVVQCLLVLLACAACARTGSDAERPSTMLPSDSAEIAASVVRQAAAADSAAQQSREARQLRLRTLQPTLGDLAARDSLDLRVEADITARRVRVLDAFDDTLAQHPIAVGS